MINYLQKAEEHFKAGVLLYMNGYYNDAISRLYYSFRSIAIHIVGKPSKGKWKHSALMRKAVMEIDRRKILNLSRKERKLIKDFAGIREDADYELVNIPQDVTETYIKLVKRLLEEVNHAESNNKT